MSSELVQKNYVAGNLTIKNRFVRNPNRYYQEDFFDALPTIESIPVVDLNKPLNTVVNRAAYSHTRNVILQTKNIDNTGIVIDANSTYPKGSTVNTYTLFNNFINENSSVILHIQSLSSDISVDNSLSSFLSVLIKKVQNGYVEFSINNSGAAITVAIHKILCSIDPQISINKNWSLKGTGALETNVFRAEGALGTGIVMSTGMTGSNTYKDNQCILHPKNSNNVFNYNHIMIKAKASHDLNVNSTNASIQVIVSVTGTGITNVKHNTTDVYSDYFKIGHPVYKAITSTDTAGSNGYIMIGILSKITAAAEPSFHFENTGLLAPVTQGDILFPNNIIPSISMDRFWSVSSQLEFECCIRTPNVLSNFCNCLATEGVLYIFNTLLNVVFASNNLSLNFSAFFIFPDINASALSGLCLANPSKVALIPGSFKKAFLVKLAPNALKSFSKASLIINICLPSVLYSVP